MNAAEKLGFNRLLTVGGLSGLIPDTQMCGLPLGLKGLGQYRIEQTVFGRCGHDG